MFLWLPSLSVIVLYVCFFYTYGYINSLHSYFEGHLLAKKERQNTQLLKIEMHAMAMIMILNLSDLENHVLKIWQSDRPIHNLYIHIPRSSCLKTFYTATSTAFPTLSEALSPEPICWCWCWFFFLMGHKCIVSFLRKTSAISQNRWAL